MEPSTLRAEQRMGSPTLQKRMASRTVTRSLTFPAVRSLSPALAIIDGALCQLTREGVAAITCAPLATAIVEFQRGPMCVYVRESPHGLLPGISNLYRLDSALRLQWLAEWPEHWGACIQIIDATADILTAELSSGAVVRLDAYAGQVISADHPMAAAG